MKAFIYLVFVMSIFTEPIIKMCLILNYEINKKEYIAKYCINKDKPKSCCAGKCKLNKQLNSVDEGNNKENQNKTELKWHKDFSKIFVQPNNSLSKIETKLFKKPIFYWENNYKYLTHSQFFHPPLV